MPGPFGLKGPFLNNGRFFFAYWPFFQALSSATVHGDSYTRSWRCDGRIFQFLWVCLGLVHLEPGIYNRQASRDTPVVSDNTKNVRGQYCIYNFDCCVCLCSTVMWIHRRFFSESFFLLFPAKSQWYIWKTSRYTTVVGISSVLEALSDQNDNLTLPLFMWSTLVFANV